MYEAEWKVSFYEVEHSRAGCLKLAAAFKICKASLLEVFIEL
jgi:hypothetical protein